MSDEIVTTGTPAAPAAPVAVEAPAAPAAPTRPLSPERAGRAAANEAARRWSTPAETPAAPTEPPAEPLPPAAEAAPSTPREDAKGRLHGDDGKFVEKPVAPDTGATPEPQAAPEVPSAETVAEPPAAPEVEPPKTVRIQLPEGDIRRMAQGLEFIDVPEHLEQLVRWNINNVTRRQEVADRDRQIRELKQQLAQKDATSQAEQKFKQTPEYAAHLTRFNQLRALEESGDVDVGVAEAYWKTAANADFQAMLNGELTQASETIVAQEEAAAAEEWTRDAYQRANGLPEPVRSLPQFNEWFSSAVEAFDTLVSRGVYERQLAPLAVEDRVDTMHRLFANHFLSFLRTQPEVQALLQKNDTGRADAAAREAEQQRRINEAAAKAVEEAKRQAANARTASPPNPLAGLPAAPRSATEDRPPEHKPDANLSGFALQKQAREQAMAAARSRATGLRR